MEMCSQARVYSQLLSSAEETVSFAFTLLSPWPLELVVALVFTSFYSALRTQALRLGAAPLFWELKRAHNQVRDKNKDLGWAAFSSLISERLGREASGKLTLSFSKLLVGKSKLSTRQEGTVLCQQRARNPPFSDITLLTPGWSRSQNRNSSVPTSHS